MGGKTHHSVGQTVVPRPSHIISAALPPVEMLLPAGQSKQVLAPPWTLLWSQHLMFCPFFFFEQRPCPRDFRPFHWQQRLWLSILFLLCFVCGPLPSVDVTTCHAKLLSHLALSLGMETSSTFETVTPCFLPGRQVRCLA